MKKNINIFKAMSFLLAFLISILHTASATQSDSKSERSIDNGYSKKRLQELEVVYRSALEEIQWVLKNYLLNDKLKNFDYNHLHIPLRRTDKGLAIRNNPFNKSGSLGESYKLGERTFRRQNVLGTGLRCFFNAVGLKAEEEVQKLKTNANNPIVRYMIANEILSATANPEQLPGTVKKAINYEQYKKEREHLNTLYEVRSSLLSSQNKDANQQDPDKLPPEYQKWTLDKQDKKIREDLRIRATSLEAFNAFLDDHIGGGNMMVSLHEVIGEAGDNVNSDYTSIDAIPYNNNFGIRIYQPVTGCMLYFMSNDAAIDVDHTPAIKKIGENRYRLFVRTKDGVVSRPLTPKNLGIRTKVLDQLWNKKLWGVGTSYQTQFLPYTNKLIENIIVNGGHFPPEGDELHLVHEFIPQDATGIAYVYHKGFHFQALIPE